jgi:hypothetical protein
MPQREHPLEKQRLGEEPATLDPREKIIADNLADIMAMKSSCQELIEYAQGISIRSNDLAPEDPTGSIHKGLAAVSTSTLAGLLSVIQGEIDKYV